jgi:hypothetical protein
LYVDARNPRANSAIDGYGQLSQHLQTFLAAYNYARRLKMLKG